MVQRRKHSCQPGIICVYMCVYVCIPFLPLPFSLFLFLFLVFFFLFPFRWIRDILASREVVLFLRVCCCGWTRSKKEREGEKEKGEKEKEQGKRKKGK